MSDLAAIRTIVDLELQDAREQGLTSFSIPPEHVSVLLLILELNHLLYADEIGDTEEWRKRVKAARKAALQDILERKENP